MEKLSQREMRNIALGAVRWQASRLGLQFDDVDSTRALRILDELSVNYPDKTASIWYINATESQIKSFRREWNKFRRGY